MQYTHMSTEILLESLIGAEATRAHYQGALAPLFESEGETAETELALIHVARELLRRWLAENIVKEGVLFPAPDAVKEYLIVAFAGQAYESFVTLYLDNQHRLITGEESFRGTLSQTSVYPREIVKRALRLNAAAVIFAHNHPSGAAEPSMADEGLTKAMKSALALIDVRVLDHLVVAGKAVTSFAEKGLV